MKGFPFRRRPGVARGLAAGLLAAAVLAAAPGIASAAKPLGKFYCYQGVTYFADLKLQANGRYTFADKYGGKWAYKPAKLRIAFTSGYFHPEFYGAHRHEGSSSVVYLRIRGKPNLGYRCTQPG